MASSDVEWDYGFSAGVDQGETNVKNRIKSILEGNQTLGNDEVLGLIAEAVGYVEN